MCPLKNKKQENENVVNNNDAPDIDSAEKVINLSREEALKLTDRFYFENQNIRGSITLTGAAIDDLIFKNYKTLQHHCTSCTGRRHGRKF